MSKKIYNFNDSLVVGAEGEEIVQKYLESKKNIHKVVNMANNEIFYHKDVDFVIQYEEPYIYKGEEKIRDRLEIKTDTYTSGNIYYEVVSNENYDVDGCMKKTECDWLAYYFIKFDKLYLLRMEDYRNLVEQLIKENRNDVKRKEVKNYAKKAGETYTSIGYTIPLYLLEERMPRNSIRIYSNIKKELETV
jgi:hypothetical protein